MRRPGRRTARFARCTLLALVAACGNFQDPDVVLDLRVIAMTAEPANQVVDVGSDSTPDSILAQLVPTRVCALTSDPSFAGGVDWQMTMCNLAVDDRCADASNGSDISPLVALGRGTIADPDTTSPEPAMCAAIVPDQDLAAVLLDSIEHDGLMGLGGIDYGVALTVGDAGSALTVNAAKTLQVMPRIPSTVTQNHNPTISGMTADVDFTGSGAGSDAMPIPLVRCADLGPTGTTPLVVQTGDTVRLMPIEPPGIHETYTIPTIDGSSQTFTEAISYQWVTGSGGSYSTDSTGGDVDLFGNVPPLYTDWYAPDPGSISSVTDIPIYIVQRDDRLGAAWFEACIRVMP